MRNAEVLADKALTCYKIVVSTQFIQRFLNACSPTAVLEMSKKEMGSMTSP